MPGYLTEISSGIRIYERLPLFRYESGRDTRINICQRFLRHLGCCLVDIDILWLQDMQFSYTLPYLYEPSSSVNPVGRIAELHLHDLLLLSSASALLMMLLSTRLATSNLDT